MVAAFIHLDAASPKNGGLFVYPGSHKLGPLEDFGPKEGSNFHYVDQARATKHYYVNSDINDVIIIMLEV